MQPFAPRGGMGCMAVQIYDLQQVHLLVPMPVPPFGGQKGGKGDMCKKIWSQSLQVQSFALQEDLIAFGLQIEDLITKQRQRMAIKSLIWK